MRSSFQGVEVLVCTFVAAYFLVFAIPSQIQGNFQPDKKIVQEKIKIEETSSVGVPAIPPQLVSSQVIQIKASGEDPLISLSDHTPFSAVRSTLDELERRYDIQPSDAPIGGSPTSSNLVHYHFEVPSGLQSMVDFWVSVFGRYSKDQYIFYNKQDASIVYSVLDLSPFDSNPNDDNDSLSENVKSQKIGVEKDRIQDILRQLAGKLGHGEPLLPDEEKFAELFSRENNVSLSEAALDTNIGIQEGLSHRFRRSIALSGQYMSEMEKIFAAKGMPIELTRLPFVESSFNVRASSSAGAKGLWQFIDPTGQRYLKIDSYVDERLDPILSTLAAAEYLKNDYRQLDSWPLTVNAYNTGLGRMQKAKEELNTEDISRIIKRFDDPGYQYFSRNYFPEFLAALTVYDHQEQFFGKVQKMPPQLYDLFIIPHDLNLKDLANSIGVDNQTMQKLNPALARDVLEGGRFLPTGYLVKVPKLMGHLFDLASLEQMDDANDLTGSGMSGTNGLGPNGSRWYLVKSEETLESIATSLGVPVESLQQANHLLPGDRVKPGTVLAMPSAAPSTNGLVMSPDGIVVGNQQVP